MRLRRIAGLALSLGMFLGYAGASKPKPQIGPYLDGSFVRWRLVQTGDSSCTTYGNTSHCSPDTRTVYDVRLGEQELPVVPVMSKKAVWAAVASMGTSVTMQKAHLLEHLMPGDHFQYRLEGDKIRIKTDKQEGVYEIYLRHQ